MFYIQQAEGKYKVRSDDQIFFITRNSHLAAKYLKYLQHTQEKKNDK